MAWTTPGTAVAGTVLTAAFWNTHVRDNLNAFSTQAWTWSAHQSFNDNINLKFGDAGDATIDYDGTNLALRPAVSGSGNVHIFGGGLEVADNESLTLGTGLDSTILFDATNLVINVGTGDVDFTGCSIAVDATEKIHLSGLAGDTYIIESSADVVDHFVGGTSRISITTTDVQMSAGLLFLNDTANAFMTKGITIDQGTADNEITTWRSTGDVAHGMTGLTTTETYGLVKKLTAGAGGLELSGFSEGGTAGLELTGRNVSPSSTKSTSGTGVIRIAAAKKSGTGATALTGSQNIVSFEDGGQTEHILAADGTSHQNVGTAWTNFDIEDDIALLDEIALQLAPDPEKVKLRAMHALRPLGREWLESHGLVTFNDDGNHFINRSGVQDLLIGAVRQGSRRAEKDIAALTRRLVRMQARLRQLEA